MNYPSAIRGNAGMEPTRLILDLVLRQIRSTATEEQEHAFLTTVGRDLAARYPLGDSGDLGALEERINDIWQMLDLGMATITVGDDAIRIRHDLPRIDGSQPGANWRSVVPALIEGAYDAWLRSMGSGPRLRTTQVERTADRVEFRHGL